VTDCPESPGKLRAEVGVRDDIYPATLSLSSFGGIVSIGNKGGEALTSRSQIA